MEYAVCAGADGFIAEHAAGAYHADGKIPALHRTHLNRRGMGAQQNGIISAGRYKKCILHIAGWVFGRKVESSEYVPVVFYLRAFSHRITEFAEDGDDFLAG